jgi:phosphoenolpyruvate synthase/pyruvate phosphate dikinase
MQWNIMYIQVRYSRHSFFCQGEDGFHFSAAGQYESYLDIQGKEAVREAIRSCLDSIKSERAIQYSSVFMDKKSCNMNIIIQEFIDAEKAGVIFLPTRMGIKSVF